MSVQAIAKICYDFRIELNKQIDTVGEFSNAEKIKNEMIHRANFRFDDLQDGAR